MENNSQKGLSAGLKTMIGVVVLGVLLTAMIVGAGVLDQKDQSATVPFQNRSPKERAELMIERGQWRAAIIPLKEMVEADPFDARSIFYLGYAHQRGNQLKEAVEWYDKAKVYYRFRLLSHYNLACIAARQNNLDLAMEELTTSIEGGFATRRGIEKDEDFAAIRGRKEFIVLIEREKVNVKRRNGRR